MTLYNVTFNLAIIPKSIYVQTRSVEVLEAGHVTLTPADIQIASQYYVDRVQELVIVRPPSHGFVQLKRTTGSLSYNDDDDDFDSQTLLQKQRQSIERFTYRQLTDKQVVYYHDSSEQPVDSFEIVAVAGTKESPPVTLDITVRPVDDERPVVVNNTGLMVWQASATVLPPSVLAAVDVDTPPSSVVLTFSGSSECGYLAAGSDWNRHVGTFSQQQINDGQIAFVHRGSCTMSFAPSPYFLKIGLIFARIC